MLPICGQSELSGLGMSAVYEATVSTLTPCRESMLRRSSAHVGWFLTSDSSALIAWAWASLAFATTIGILVMIIHGLFDTATYGTKFAILACPLLSLGTLLYFDTDSEMPSQCV